MTQHTITVDGQQFRFEAHSYPMGNRMMIEAPGVAPFDVTSLGEARDTLRSVYSKAACA